MSIKQYKLLKDLPFAKAGTVVKYNSEIEEYSTNGQLCYTTEQMVYEQFLTNTEWFEPIRKKSIVRMGKGNQKLLYLIAQREERTWINMFMTRYHFQGYQS